jgi:hypothetical protein
MNTTYKDYPFTVKGINFFSRVYTHSELFNTIERLPMGVFEAMNRDAVEELIGDPSELSTPELLNELTHLNAGGSHAFIMLGDN